MLKSQFIYTGMENLKTYKNQIEEVQHLVNELEKGNLSKEDLVKLEALTRMIHERSIILKYIALGGNSSEVIEDVALQEEKTVEEEKEDEPILFEIPKEKKVEIDIFADMKKEDEEVEVPSPISDIMDDLMKEEPNFVNETIEEELTQKVVHEMEEQHKEDEMIIESVIEEMEEISITERVVEEMEEIEISEKVVEAMEVVDSSDENKTFLEQLNLNDDSLHAMFSSSKIDTLVGAFSLNEKLRFMNDLFDGSSEDFNETIKVLDSKDDIQSANAKINELALKFEWDSEDEAVAEFVSFVNRRYA